MITKIAENNAENAVFIFSQIRSSQSSKNGVSDTSKMKMLAIARIRVVVPMRFELMTFRLSAGRSNRAKLWDQ